MGRRPLLGPVLAALLLAAPGPGTAGAAVDLVELAFGVSNINAAIGNGGLSLGISRVGEVTVLTWPSPSYTDHLLYLGSNDPDTRARRILGAHPAMGIFMGLRVTRADGGEEVTWLRDPGWEVAQRYPDPLAPRVETVFEHAALGLTVVQTDLVSPEDDVWSRHLAVSRHAGSPVQAAAALGYWNLSPTLSRVPQLPLADWVMDAYNDFGALWDDGAEAIIHFRPAGRGDLVEIVDLVLRPWIDYGPLGQLGAEGPPGAARVAAFVEGLDAELGPGVYLVVGADRPVEGFQVGFDDTPICDLVDHLVDNVQRLPERLPDVTLPLDPSIANLLRCTRDAAAVRAEVGWAEPPIGAWTDLADGRLSGSMAAAGQTDSALAVPLTFGEAGAGAGVAEVTFHLAAASTAGAARQLLAGARARSMGDHVGALEAHWHPLLGRIHLPRGASPWLREVCQRAIMNLLIAMDRDTGAIVASISRQAPYGLDWPRDGAFFNVALDVAGLTAHATHHGAFTVATQRLEEVAPDPLINGPPPPDPDDPGKATYPAGAWEMNYYADGLVGGNIRWEIDNAGLAVWGLIDHARYLEGAERDAWRRAIWPTVERASDLLARWRDPATGLHAPAYEDDNHEPTQTLHGAITTWLALDRSVGLARALAHEDAAERWRARADELGAAIEVHLMDPSTGRFIEELDETVNPGNAAGGASAWALWPAGFLAPDDPRLTAVVDWLLTLSEERLTLSHGGGAYIPKMLVAIALADRRPATRAALRDLIEALARDTTTPDTAIFGEVFVAVDDTGDGRPDRFDARVSNPHVWAGVLTYLAAMALDEPERFEAPLGPEPPAAARGGGGCAASPGPAGPAGLALLALWSVLAAARRRRRGQRSSR